MRHLRFPPLRVAKSQNQYAENTPARRFFTFSPLMGVSTSAVSKAKTHPRRTHFQCSAVLNELICVWARHKIAGILAYAEIFNAALAQSNRLKPYCFRLLATPDRTSVRLQSVKCEIQLDFSAASQRVGKDLFSQ